MKESAPRSDSSGESKKINRRAALQRLAALGAAGAGAVFVGMAEKTEKTAQAGKHLPHAKEGVDQTEPNLEAAEQQAAVDKRHEIFIEGLRAGDFDSVIAAALMTISYEREIHEIAKTQMMLTRLATKSLDNAALQAGVSNELIFLGQREEWLRHMAKQFREVPEVSEFIDAENERLNQESQKPKEEISDRYSNI